MYGRHRNGLGIDPATGTGTVIGSDGKEYQIGPGADLIKAYLTGAFLTGAYLVGARFTGATVDPEHVPLIEAAHRQMISSLTVNSGRAPNPGRRR